MHPCSTVSDGAIWHPIQCNPLWEDCFGFSNNHKKSDKDSSIIYIIEKIIGEENLQYEFLTIKNNEIVEINKIGNIIRRIEEIKIANKIKTEIIILDGILQTKDEIEKKEMEFINMGHEPMMVLDQNFNFEYCR